MFAFDAIIVGGGPAGASCALWLKQLGLRPCIVERRSTLGGLQNESVNANDWIAPMVGMRGEEVAHGMHVNILSRRIACYLGASVDSVVARDDGYVVDVAVPKGRTSIRAPHLVLASGVRPADGGLRGSANVIIGPGKQVAYRAFRGQSVAVLGGGDNAFENYEFIRDKGAASVHIFARSIRARREFLERIPADDVRVGPYQVDAEKMLVDGQPYDAIVVLYGWTPALEYMRGHDLACDERGFVRTARDSTETSMANVFAIGEVAQRMHPCCVTSMADGVVAAKEIQRRIEAGATQAFLSAVRPTSAATAVAGQG